MECEAIRGKSFMWKKNQAGKGFRGNFSVINYLLVKLVLLIGVKWHSGTRHTSPEQTGWWLLIQETPFSHKCFKLGNGPAAV